MPSKLSRTLAILIILLALCFAGLLILGPKLGGHLAQDALDRAGIEGIDIGHIGYDLIDQEIHIGIVQETTTGGAEGRISIAVDLGDLLDRTADIHTLTLEDLVIELEPTEKGWEPRLPELPQGGNDSPPWTWGVREIDLHNLTLRFLSDPPVAFSNIDGIIRNINPDRTRQPVRFEISGSLAGGRVSLQGRTTPFAATPSADLHLHLDPLSLTGLTPLLPLPSGTRLSGNLGGRSDLHISQLPEGISLTGSAILTLTDTHLQREQSNLQLRSLEFGGSFEANEDRVRLAEGYLTGNALKLTQEERELALASFDIEGVEATKEGLTAAVLRSSSVRLAPISNTSWALPDGVEGDGFDARGIELKATAGRIESLRIGGLMTALQLLPLPEESPQGDTPPPAISEEKAAQKEPWQWTIAEISLNSAASLLLEDLRFDARNHVLIGVEQCSLRGLGGPGPSDITLAAQGSLNRYARFEVAATGVTDGSAGQGELKLTSLSLPDISPYLQRNYGQRVKSGHLDLTAKMDAKGAHLDGTLDIHLGRLELEAVKDEQGEKGSNLPLRSALRLLRNGKGDIDLKIPVKGDRQSPDFSLNRVVTQAIINGTKSGVTSYYAPVGISLLTGVALPVGALSVAGKVAGWITSYRFREIGFPEGSAVLGQPELTYLDEVSNLLQKRPAARLLICGYASESEQGGGLTPAARRDLAAKRSDEVKSYLVDQDIAPERLFLCDPTVDTSPKAKGRVELLL